MIITPDGWPSQKYQWRQRAPWGEAFPSCSVSVSPCAEPPGAPGRARQQRGAWGGRRTEVGQQRMSDLESEPREQRPGRRAPASPRHRAPWAGCCGGTEQSHTVKCCLVLLPLLYFLYSPCPCPDGRRTTWEPSPQRRGFNCKSAAEKETSSFERPGPYR